MRKYSEFLFHLGLNRYRDRHQDRRTDGQTELSYNIAIVVRA